MTDIVIPMIKGSRHNDLELRCCLRSLKFLKNYSRVFLIGYKPDWVTNVEHVEFTDGPCKQSNIRNKILKAFEVIDHCLFMNDDHFILQEADAENYPYYFDGELDQVAEKGAKILLKQLEARNWPKKHFDVHTPIFYRKADFIASQCFTNDSTIKSAYGNYLKLEGTPFKDLKINSQLRTWRIKETIKDRPCFSVGDFGLNADMKQVLSELYPTKSIYEI